MNIFITLLSAIFITLSCSSCNKIDKHPFQGKAEVLLNSTIYRINLENKQVNIVLNKNSDYLVSSFDISLGNGNRIIATREWGNEQERLLLFSEKNVYKVLFKKDFIRYPSFSPDGENFAYLSSNKEGQSNKYIDDWYLYITNVDGTIDKKILDIPVGLYKPSWLKDGRSVLITSKDLCVYIVNTLSGEYRKILDHGIAPTVSQKGNHIAYLSSKIDPALKTKLIEYVNMTTDEYVSKTEGIKTSNIFPNIQELYFKNSLFIYDIDSGVSRQLTKKTSIDSGAIWSPDDKYLMYNDESYLNHDIIIINVNTGDIEKIDKTNGKVMNWNP